MVRDIKLQMYIFFHHHKISNFAFSHSQENPTDSVGRETVLTYLLAVLLNFNYIVLSLETCTKTIDSWSYLQKARRKLIAGRLHCYVLVSIRKKHRTLVMTRYFEFNLLNLNLVIMKRMGSVNQYLCTVDLKLSDAAAFALNRLCMCTHQMTALFCMK